MKTETLWKVLPFPAKRAFDRNKISSEKWADFNDFLTNGSTGVYAALVNQSDTRDIENGSVVIVDTNLAPLKGDIVIETENGAVSNYEPGSPVFGVVVCVVQLLDSHRRQRTL